MSGTSANAGGAEPDAKTGRTTPQATTNVTLGAEHEESQPVVLSRSASQVEMADVAHSPMTSQQPPSLADGERGAEPTTEVPATADPPQSELSDRQRRYAAPYDYPPEAQVVRSAGAEIVVGIPIEGGESESDDAPNVAYVASVSLSRRAGPTFVMAEDGTISLASPIALAHAEACLDREASELLAAFEMSGNVRHCAVAELVACALFAVVLVWFLVLLPLPIVLFAATRRYNVPATVIGGIFFPAAVAMRFYAAYLVSMWAEPARTIVILLIVFMAMADIYVAVGTARFVRTLRHTSADLVTRLRDGWMPGPDDLERAQRHRSSVEDARSRPPDAANPQ